jgi:hypothetical protein
VPARRALRRRLDAHRQRHGRPGLFRRGRPLGDHRRAGGARPRRQGGAAAAVQPQALPEVEPEALFDSSAETVYALDPEAIDGALQKALAAGKLFRFDFNPRGEYNKTAILLANDQGTFAIVGDRLQIPWCELEKPAVDLGDADEGDDGELDFEMF